MYKWLQPVVLLIITNTLLAQPKILPEEAKEFILPGYAMLDYVTGDINNDTRPDALLVLKLKGEDTLGGEVNRRLLILTRQKNGKLKKAIQNDSAILCYQCGGIFGDPYEGIEMKKNGFEIRFYGGSSWRWASHYTFSYIPSKRNWYLMRQYDLSYHNTDIDETQQETTIEKEELGDIPVTSFNANAGSTESTWKVTAAKTFFYNNPKIGSKPRKGYLLKGDVITSYKQYKNFVWVYFSNKAEKSTKGFILKKDLLKIE
jgi:hypothetical protein